jgi:galactokinase
MNPQSAIRNPQSAFSAMSPGRLDIMGGIADYSGSLLLQMPIRETTRVSLTRREGHIFSAHTDTEEIDQHFEIEQDSLKGLRYSEAGERIRSTPGGHWAVYVLGCYLVLEKEKGLAFNGDHIDITSDIPTGKGVSSSAAIEMATLHAIQKAYNINIDPLELALLAQKVENLVVGAACGLMDQLSVSLGKKDHLLPIICQPHMVMDPIRIPEGMMFVGMDSGIRHAVSGASYTDVRAAAFMAYTILSMSMGVEKSAILEARETGQWSELPFRGFLGNIPLEQFTRQYAALVPENISGEKFMNQFGVSVDTVTEIDLHKTYAVRNAAFHPVMENHRIHQFRELIQGWEESGQKRTVLQQMGELMFGSHEGYVSVGLGESITNKIVALVRQAGPQKGVYGARISGGGSGGTVVILADTQTGIETVNEIHRKMKEKTGRELYLFSGSSDGAHYVNTLL